MMLWKSYAAALHESNDSRIRHTSPSETTDSDSACFHIPMPSQRDTQSPPRSTKPSSTFPDQILPSKIQLAIIDAYFAHHLVHYPNHRGAKVSHKLYRQVRLDTALVSCPVCLRHSCLRDSDQVIYRSGFDSRQFYLRKFYNYSKMIFFAEADNEEISDQLSRVQAALLLHHMWLSPNSTMDCWSWLSLAIRLA